MEQKNNQLLMEISEDIGELKGLVNGLDQRLSSLDNRVQGVINHHETRLNAITKETASMKGRSAGIAFAISAIISAIGLVIVLIKGFM